MSAPSLFPFTYHFSFSPFQLPWCWHQFPCWEWILVTETQLHVGLTWNKMYSIANQWVDITDLYTKNVPEGSQKFSQITVSAWFPNNSLFLWIDQQWLSTYMLMVSTSIEKIMEWACQIHSRKVELRCLLSSWWLRYTGSTQTYIYTLSLSSYEFCCCLTLVDHFTLSAAVLWVWVTSCRLCSCDLWSYTLRVIEVDWCKMTVCHDLAKQLSQYLYFFSFLLDYY